MNILQFGILSPPILLRVITAFWYWLTMAMDRIVLASVSWLVDVLSRLDNASPSVLLLPGIITRTYKFQRRRGAAPPAVSHCNWSSRILARSNVAAGCPVVLSDNLTLTTEILIVTRPHISPRTRNVQCRIYIWHLSLRRGSGFWR